MDKFEPLNDETTILMLHQDTLTVARWKKLIQNRLGEQLSKAYYGSTGYIRIAYFFYPHLALFDEFDEEVKISIKDVQLRFPPEGQECKLLNFKTKEWETGKLRILANVKIIWDNSEPSNIEINKVILEFAPEHPSFEYESPLDEIRNSFSG